MVKSTKPHMHLTGLVVALGLLAGIVGGTTVQMSADLGWTSWFFGESSSTEDAAHAAADADANRSWVCKLLGIGCPAPVVAPGIPVERPVNDGVDALTGEPEMVLKAPPNCVVEYQTIALLEGAMVSFTNNVTLVVHDCGMIMVENAELTSKPGAVVKTGGMEVAWNGYWFTMKRDPQADAGSAIVYFERLGNGGGSILFNSEAPQIPEPVPAEVTVPNDGSTVTEEGISNDTDLMPWLKKLLSPSTEQEAVPQGGAEPVDMTKLTREEACLHPEIYTWIFCPITTNVLMNPDPMQLFNSPGLVPAGSAPPQYQFPWMQQQTTISQPGQTIIVQPSGPPVDGSQVWQGGSSSVPAIFEPADLGNTSSSDGTHFTSTPTPSCESLFCPGTCGDEEDNDESGQADGLDSKCTRNEGLMWIRSCIDGVDNDANNGMDATDSKCSTNEGLLWPASCADGLDNDRNGVADAADTKCAGHPAADCESLSCASTCGDGEDNDEDGFADARDSKCIRNEGLMFVRSCTDGVDNDATNGADGTDPKCNNIESFMWPASCADGVDNDRNGTTDGADPKCSIESSSSSSTSSSSDYSSWSSSSSSWSSFKFPWSDSKTSAMAQ